MPWSLHELSFSEGTQALFCSNAEQSVSPLTCIFPPIRFSVHDNVHLSCQQLGLGFPDPFLEQFCTMVQSLFTSPDPSGMAGTSNTHLH